jgi:hypothetical protein
MRAVNGFRFVPRSMPLAFAFERKERKAITVTAVTWLGFSSGVTRWSALASTETRTSICVAPSNPGKGGTCL